MYKLLVPLFAIVAMNTMHAQEVKIKVEEDYNAPPAYMWEPTDEFSTGVIENGMYISKAGSLYAKLDFQYDISNRQDKYTGASDMEFTIVKIKGDKTDFICIQVDPISDGVHPYLVFRYNASGEWQLTDRKSDVIYKNGTAAINELSNIIKVQHRGDKLRYSVNGVMVLEYNLAASVKINWSDVSIYSRNKKYQLGLDRAVFIGYLGTAEFENNTQTETPIQNTNEVVGAWQEGKATYVGTQAPITFDYNAKWKLTDFASVDWGSQTMNNLTIDGGETNGYIWVTTDTTSMSPQAYIEKNIHPNYFDKGVPRSYVKLTDQSVTINGIPARLLQANYSAEVQMENTMEIYCLFMKDGRYYQIYSSINIVHKNDVLNTVQSFTLR